MAVSFMLWSHVTVLLASVTSLTSVWTGSGLGALVFQSPSTMICKSGATVQIQCQTVDLQATTMFWYRQFPKQGLTLMVTSNVGSSTTHEQGFPAAKFPVSHPNLKFSSLTVTSSGPGDSGLYFCGASHTAWSRDERPRQEPQSQPLGSHHPEPEPWRRWGVRLGRGNHSFPV